MPPCRIIFLPHMTTSQHVSSHGRVPLRLLADNEGGSPGDSPESSAELTSSLSLLRRPSTSRRLGKLSRHLARDHKHLNSLHHPACPLIHSRNIDIRLELMFFRSTRSPCRRYFRQYRSSSSSGRSSCLIRINRRSRLSVAEGKSEDLPLRFDVHILISRSFSTTRIARSTLRSVNACNTSCN